MTAKLELKPKDRLVDLGCGTGIYACEILRQVPLRHPILGVDPFPEMLARVPSTGGIALLQMDASTFATSSSYVYNKVLMKEAVHHVVDRPKLCRDLYDRLPAGGIVLLVHVPPELEYPLFRQALLRARAWHAVPEEVQEQLRFAGFRVEADELEYSHTIACDEYFAMVRARYMSVLSSFSDEKLEQGLQEMRQRYDNEAMLRFTERFDFLTALK